MMDGVITMAEEISRKSPVAIQTTKASLVYSRDHSVQEGLNHIVSVTDGVLCFEVEYRQSEISKKLYILGFIKSVDASK